MKGKMAQDVPLDIDSGGYLSKNEPLFGQSEHATLGDVQNFLTLVSCDRAAECHLCNVLDEFAYLAFADYAQASFLDGELRTARGEVAHKDHFFCVLADVDEASATRDAVSEPTGVDIPKTVAFCKPQKGAVEPAAINKIKLSAMIDYGLAVY